ncbi:uncharacterized protein LOC130826253 [Amaranthus tricolor]|uniref:uncharacterized protein LOC130826253 n=1 Tax=Amaranthus tricolor TaxID=29722 RepID=UPI0025892980|nr:uncharacterized protein LOC130826253 [Amaranthus tricolor]
MAAAKACAAGLMSAIATATLGIDVAYADSPLKIPSFSNYPPQEAAEKPTAAPLEPEKPARPRNDNPRTTSAGFNTDDLVYGVNLLKDIEKSGHAKEVFKVTMEHEKTKKEETKVKLQEAKAQEAYFQNDKQKLAYKAQEELTKLAAEIKSKLAKYNDELKRKRLMAENEYQRQRNRELVEMQEQMNTRLEAAKRATEEEIQTLRRQTEREKAEYERETIRVKAIADAEGRALEKKLAEEVNRRMLKDRVNAEREKWVSAINTTFDHIGGGLRTILTDTDKLVVAVGGFTALALGIYTTREGAKVMWSHIDRILGQPSLIRESSRGKYPWSNVFSRATGLLRSKGETLSKNGNGFGDVVLHSTLLKRIQLLASATAHTKAHRAPFRNMLFYGPPGTGKTMAARELAKKSGLDYALMTGGDVAPLGAQAVTKIHQMFDWAKKSDRGLLLFIDEADAFLCERNKTYMSEAQRSALNALLFRTGDQSKDIVLALATNRPGDLDSAVADRIDEVLEFPLPGEDERYKIVKLYLDKYISQAGSQKPGFISRLFNKQQHMIETKGLTDELLREAAAKTVGFSGREIAKLMASVQAAVYGTKNCILDPQLFHEVVDYKVAEHQQRRMLAGANESSPLNLSMA